jgi:hypothetical protein
MAANDLHPDVPYCGNCGYQLSGAVESSRCPECGRPLVEVLMRGGRWGRRYRSRATLFGLPVVSIAYGPAPGERIGRPRGIIALGDSPVGVLAVGGMAKGLVAVGGVAVGVVSCGGVSVSVMAAMGGVALGALAYGGVALGLLASGGLVIGLVASGGLAVGLCAAGGFPVGPHTVGPGTSSPEAVAMLGRFGWFFGAGRGPSMITQPLLAVSSVILAGAALAGLLAALGALRGRASAPDGD